MLLLFVGVVSVGVVLVVGVVGFALVLVLETWGSASAVSLTGQVLGPFGSGTVSGGRPEAYRSD